MRSGAIDIIVIDSVAALVTRAEIEGERCLGKQVEVYYDDTATLKLDGDQSVSALYVNGVRQRDGVYGSAASRAKNVVSGFEGTGRLIVGRLGTVVTFF